MLQKLLRSKNVHALLIAYALVAAGLLFLVQANPAAAAAPRDTLVVGLQNDMVNPNYFDTATNSVWKQYHVEFNFEGLVTHDPDFTSYNVLSDPSVTTCPSGSVVPLPYTGGICVDTATGKLVTVFLRHNVTFTNGAPFTADDVVFTYQTLPWSTYQLSVLNAIWWDAPTYPLWNSTTYGGACSGAKCVSHVGIQKVGTYEVQFHLAQTYALLFFDTLEVPIIPKSVWSGHMGAWPQLNLSDPSRSLTDSYDNSIDTSWNNVAAATGTGPFMLTSWVRNSGATIDIYTGYWGKTQTHVWRSEPYPNYPAAVRHIVTKIYGSLDVVSLALQKGDIDTLVWSLTPGFLTQIQSNPAISVAQVTDSGYFYMAFNLRQKPWGQESYSLTLRKAISMAIDKDYIVNTLMGGFGVKGTVPIGISNPLYVNTSASPPAFNIAAGRALLVANGFADVNGDGFLEAPDGSPIKTTILTPPKDYDPVRADAGIMISNNLKAMGLNIDAAPTSFDTIVAKAFVAPVSFDIYILGWSLGDFPETYICSFFCTSQDVNLGTGGSNSPGYSNSRVDALIASAITDTDTVSRVQKIKDVEGIVVNDLPWNVLYYRKNLNAYRNDAWQGWANYPNGGGIYNPWSISHITPAGTSVPVTGGSLTVALSLPDQVYARENVSIGVEVAQGTSPAGGASVTLNLTYGSTYVLLTGTTDTNGHASFSWVVPVIQGNVLVAASASKGTLVGTNGKVMEVTIGPPAPTAELSLSTPTPVIAPSGTATITATLKDGTGAAIAGRTVTIDSTLVLGTVTPASATTNAGGTAAFTYTPPSATKFQNQHLTEVIKASTSVPNTIVGDTQKASLIIFVQNDATPAWMILRTTPTSPNGLILTNATSSSACSQAPISLGSAANFAVLGGSTVTSTGPSIVTGDLGVSPGTSVTGFPPGTLVGTLHAGDAVAAQAQLDLTAAYDDAVGRTACAVTVSGDLGGQTLTPGTYTSTSSLAITSGDLTLDAQGNANAVFIFQMGSTLTVTSGRSVILAGNAQASNVFWQVGSSATFGTTSSFAGTVMASQSITLMTGAILDGRALASVAAVSLDSNVVTAPGGPGGGGGSGGAQSANFTVTVRNWSGAVVPNIDIDPEYTDVWNISVAPATAGSNKTDGNGQAKFTVTETASAIAGENATNVALRFVARNAVNATSNLLELLVTNATSKGYAAMLTFRTPTMPFDSAGARDGVTVHVWNETGVPANNVPVIFQIDYGDLGVPAQFDWAYNYDTFTYLGTGLDMNSFAQGSLGGSFANSPVNGDPTIGTKWGVENFVEDLEVVGNLGVVDSCDSSTWPAGFDGLYYINATSATDASGTYSADFTAMPHKIDSRIQMRAYIGGTPDVVADACNFVSSIENYAFRIDSGVVSQRAPLFAMSSLSMSRPILTSQTLSVTFTAAFKGLGGTAVDTPEVILVQGAGSAARNVKGTFGGTMFGTSAGVVTYTRTVSLLSLSQSFSFAFIPADFRYAYGGRDQLFAGAFGDYWFAPTFAALLSKIPYEFKVAYLYLPTTTAFLTVSLDRTLLPPGGTATATVYVYSILTGAPIAGATVWTGSTQNTTDANGMATLTVSSSALGATEGLVVATTPYGGAARGWYAMITTPPVVTYGTPTIDAKEPGIASTITVTVTNTLPIAGSTTVWLYVDNKTVASQVVNFTASGSKTVTFSYMFPTSGTHYVTVGDQSATTNVPAQTVVGTDNTLLYGLAIGLLIVGLIIGALVGMMLSRRGRRPPTQREIDESASAERKAEEELPPEDKL